MFVCVYVSVGVLGSGSTGFIASRAVFPGVLLFLAVRDGFSDDKINDDDDKTCDGGIEFIGKRLK